MNGFRAELQGCGLRADLVEALCTRYEQARGGAPGAWEALYREIFEEMYLLAATASQRDTRSLNSIMLLLEDDLGAQLFGRLATAELHARLLEPAYAVN